MTTSFPSLTDTIKCLLIDDDADDQEIFSLALQEFGDKICCYFEDDGAKAIANLLQDEMFHPHCIFIDINMPRMNGVECLGYIRQIDRLKEIPVCMVSTSADPSIVLQTQALGAVDFIVKPPSISVLTGLLKDFFYTNVLLK